MDATATTTPKKGTAKKTVKKTDDSLKAILEPTAETRIKRLENFIILTERHKKLSTKKDELDSFNVGTDGLNEKIIIQCDDQIFEVSNSQVIADLKMNMEKKLNDLLEHSESQIVAFNI
ncbi:hypothetical protein [Nonlabens dokdonensis]|uniref:hypothetical protein n=1 Tax=Nonlabens dokdonensis TaxID=328515 RepID=UPI0026F1F51D|nr:hypothetical protein [Nonlabens dokdonensis]